MPGGMGTIDELSEAFVLAQTKRIRPLPIILYQSTFWNGFLDWVRSTMVSGGYIRASEVDDLVTVCDTPEPRQAATPAPIRHGAPSLPLLPAGRGRG